MIKFVFGPIIGYTLGLSLFETIFFSTLGMAITTILFLFFHNIISYFFYRKKNKHREESKKKKILFWKKYGIKTIILITPIILSPPLGMTIVLSLKENKKTILWGMLLSATCWSIILSFSVYHFSGFILNIFHF